MNARLLIPLLAGLAVMAVPLAAADPPGTCVGGYNPNALSNVCYSLGTAGTLNTGTVGTTPGPVVCPIGQLCTPAAPVPTYDPNGGVSVPVPGTPSLTYLEVLGVVLVPGPSPFLPPCADGYGVTVGGTCVESCDTPDSTGVRVGTSCLTPTIGSCGTDGSWVSVAGKCLVHDCDNGAGVQVATKCVTPWGT